MNDSPVKLFNFPAIVHKRKRFLVVGCTHGEYIHPDFAKATLRFKAAFKPDTVIHLGDAYDTQCFRGGAVGTPDEAHPIEGDLAQGRNYLLSLEPSVFCVGNHENRCFKMMHHHVTERAVAASCVWQRMLDPVHQLKATVIPYAVHSQYKLGNYLCFHGFSYGANYLRDTALAFGNSIVAHAHRPGVAKANRLDNPVAFGTGTGMRISEASYALERLGTLAWGYGFVYGEYTDDRAYPQLHQWPFNEDLWELPL
jgi:hypothetical protein